MSRVRALIKGEFDRLSKYNLFTASFVASVFYVLMGWVMEPELIAGVLPLVFLMDSTLMTSLLVGATLFYEKKEHTINSIMVTPATCDEYMAAKLVANLGNSMFTVLLLSAAMYVLKGVTFRYAHVVVASLATTALHTFIGVRIAYTARNFTSMLVTFMVYTLMFFMPSILIMTGLIGGRLADLAVLSPLETSASLMRAAFSPDVPAWKLIFGYAYTMALSIVIYFFAVKPRFNEYMMREMGV